MILSKCHLVAQSFDRHADETQSSHGLNFGVTPIKHKKPKQKS